MPGIDTEGLEITAVLPRENPHDVVVSHARVGLEDLPVGSVIGTSSLRRRVQIETLRPDLRFMDTRGNVETRLSKVEQNEYDAVVLAAAGMLRLGLADRIDQYLDPAVCTPAPGQGIVALQARVDTEVASVLSGLTDADAAIVARIERGVAVAIGANCNSPFGVLALLDDSKVRVRGFFSGNPGELTRSDEEAMAGESELLIQRTVLTLSS